MLNLILIGPQGSGKGTQADNIVAEFHLDHIEAGALIRAAAQMGDRRSMIIDHLANQKGQLLPDGVVLTMIYAELTRRSSQTGFLFDGFPRSVKQYEALKDILIEKHLKLSGCIYLKISDAETMKRLSSRRLCELCHKGYSLAFEPDRTICDCGGELIKRPDDEPEAISHRLQAFHDTTEPILTLMKQDGNLIEIDGERSVDVIFADIKQQLYSLNT